ncbi:unnamed protein product [Rotaria sordida]|uniref:Mitochondrial import inner membrane translocase subunit Tim16 n=1 Tax=Rotaria sordida TaxID=392033 RepID=A0A819CI21_9BILA|nr:unnamed protein product [Rotaria sordida]CAF1207906.1 unnamed protein product [Rotaria sordida]CAF1544583.1 unnamed protein product [Rotaria sordida]CAF3733769.1 unnamed protein product [Rotaria sordida]CAF3812697.1 unnamed protein product [Rotaria sordida]
MAKQLIQIAILGSQVIARAFTRALRQELQYAKTAQQSGKTSAKTVQADRVTGMSLQEAKQILNISDADINDIEKINKHYEHLFNLNDKTKGGSFYLQSKIYRAKERFDQELKVSSTTENSNRNKQKEDPSDSTPS